MLTDLELLILKLIDKHDGEWSWYHLDRAISNGPTGFVGPIRNQIEKLISNSFLEQSENPLTPGMPLYRITGRGRSTLPSYRERRMLDFERRLLHDPSNVRIHSNGTWRWMQVHPMSDDSELLVKLDMGASDCTSVDAYWDTGQDIVFLELLTADLSVGGRTPGLYARIRSDDGGTVVHLVLDVSAISSVEVESAMIRAMECGLAAAEAPEQKNLCEALEMVRDDSI